jgi:phage baseplate assembly protein W
MPYKSLEITTAASLYKQAPKTSQFYNGFSSIDIGNTNSKLYDLDLIQQDLLNQFHTKKGERVMNPGFGTIVWDLLEEPMTPDVHDLLVTDLQNICSSDPRITPTQINVNDQPGGYLVEITVQLVGTDQTTSMRLTFNKHTGLAVQ